MFKKNPVKIRPNHSTSDGASADHRSAAGLDRLDLSLGVWVAAETGWKLAAVEELALGSGDGAEVTAGD